MSKVLLVDDDRELAAMLREYLEQEGFEVVTVGDGEAGVREAISGQFDIVVLDVMLPKLGGVEVLRRIRGQSAVPVLMLTAKGSDIDRILGLELGADDYVPKPATPRELVARLKAILRRTQGESGGGDVVAVDGLLLWPAKRMAEWQGRPLELTSTELNLLLVLARNAGRVVSKAELSQQALGRPLTRFDRSIDVHLSSIRAKLAPLADGRSRIQTVRGQGYQWVRE